jgi:signal transduction histidine kinase
MEHDSGQPESRVMPSVGHASHHSEPPPLRELDRQAQDRTGELTLANHLLEREIHRRKRLEREILAIGERERRRIGQELHDSIGQQLTGIAIMSRVLEQKLRRRHVPEAGDAEEIARLASQALAETRQLSRGLYPIDLDENGLTSALSTLAGVTQNVFGVRCMFDTQTPVAVSDSSAAVHVYRIAQEAITNAIRHGQARNIQIGLTSDGNYATLVVRNDGVAFPRELPENKGMGMQVMRHRAEMIDGVLTVNRGTQGGTEVVCVFAMKPKSRAGETEHG